MTSKALGAFDDTVTANMSSKALGALGYCKTATVSPKALGVLAVAQRDILARFARSNSAR